LSPLNKGVVLSMLLTCWPKFTSLEDRNGSLARLPRSSPSIHSLLYGLMLPISKLLGVMVENR